MTKNKKENCNHNIKCDVASCKHNDKEEGCCDLEEIKVSCDCDNYDCEDCDDTVCESFEANEENNNLTDNEYEVESESDENTDEEDEYENNEKEDE